MRTNVGYSTVAQFITQNETAQDIQEALEMLKTWNPSWKLDQKNLELKLPKWKSEHVDSHIFFTIQTNLFGFAYTGLNNAACKWHAVFYSIVCFKFIPILIIEFQGIPIVALLSLFSLFSSPKLFD